MQSIKRVTKPSVTIITNRIKFILYGIICRSPHNSYCFDFFSSILGLTLLILLALSIFGYIVITITPPILLTIWRNETIVSYDARPFAGDTAAALAIVAHISSFVARIGLLCAALIVRCVWLDHAQKINQLTDTTTSSENVENTSLQQMKAKLEFLIEDYKTAGEAVAAIHSVLQAWFVMHWIAYFINSVYDSTLAIKMLFGGQILEHIGIIIFTSTHLIYDFSVFIFLYCCGSLMNYYHRKYRKQLSAVQRQVLSQIPADKYLWIVQCASGVIPENADYQFVPSLGLVDIPLDNPGYTLTMLLTLFAFLINLIPTLS